MPRAWQKLVTKSTITRGDHARDVQPVLEFLEFYTGHQKCAMEGSVFTPTPAQALPAVAFPLKHCRPQRYHYSNPSTSTAAYDLSHDKRDCKPSNQWTHTVAIPSHSKPSPLPP